MTNQELIKELQKLPMDCEVHIYDISQDYHSKIVKIEFDNEIQNEIYIVTNLE